MKNILSPKNKVAAKDLTKTEEQEKIQFDSVDPNSQTVKKAEFNSIKPLVKVANNQHITESVERNSLPKPDQKEVLHKPTTCGFPQTSMGACNDCPSGKDSVKTKILTFEKRRNENVPQIKNKVPSYPLEPKIRILTDGVITDIIAGRGTRRQISPPRSQRRMDIVQDRTEDEIEVIEEGIYVDKSKEKEKKRSRFRKWMRRLGETCSELLEKMYFCCNNINVV